MRGGYPDDLLWNRARIVFELRAPGGRSVRSIRLRRPHGLIGRIVGADIAIADTGVSARHAYLHVDDRGVCVIDLASRGGTRVNGASIASAWLRLGDVVEIAGREIELKEVQVDGFRVDPLPRDDSPLADSGERLLVGLSLEPQDRLGASWAVGSELVFVGRDASCGIRLDGEQIAKTHCVLSRSSVSAYIIDLLVQRTSVNNQQIRGAAALADGDVLEIGRERFLVRVEPFSGEHPSIWNGMNRQVSPRDDAPSTDLDRVPASRVPASRPAGAGPSFPIESIPLDAQGSALAWMLGALQAGQGELIRKQNDLQAAMSEVLRQTREDSAQALGEHLQRIDGLNRELIELKRIVADRNARPQGPVPTDLASSSTPPISADGARRPPTPPPGPRPNPPRHAPEEHAFEAIAPQPTPPMPLPPGQEESAIPAVTDRSRETTAWLLDRIDQLDDKNKFSFRRMLGFGRAAPRRDATPPLEDETSLPPTETDDLENGPRRPS